MRKGEVLQKGEGRVLRMQLRASSLYRAVQHVTVSVHTPHSLQAAASGAPVTSTHCNPHAQGHNGSGTNMLGQLLMRVRSELRQQG